jgi:hypothetical protein
MKRPVLPKGPKEPNDITRRVPKIDLTNMTINDIDAEPEDDEWLDPLIAMALEQAKESGLDSLDIETQLKMMDYFVSQPGSTEDRVGERRIMALEGWDQDRQKIADEIDRLVDQERVNYLELPVTEIPTKQQLEASETGGIAKIPSNQLAHGEWYAIPLLYTCSYSYSAFRTLQFHFHSLSFIVTCSVLIGEKC